MKVTIMSMTQYENQIWEKRLKALGREFSDIRLVTSYSNPIPKISEKDAPNIIIINNIDITRDSIKKFIESHCSVSFFGLLNEPIEKFLNAFSDCPHLKILAKPIETNVVYRLVRKELTSEPLKQQMFRRYPAQQMVVLRFGGKEFYTSRLCNLSRGGAFITVEGEEPPDGEFDFIMPLKELDKTYEIRAKVIWQTRQSSVTNLGVQFIDKPLAGSSPIIVAGRYQ